tara:strand:+ start:4210 stop:4833 length:624 start_codon:yes stop_codon:yes gene_type:complete
MKKELIKLFATPVLITKYEGDLTKELKYVETKLRWQANGNNKNFRSADSYLFKKKIFSKIKKFCQESIEIFDNQILNTDQKLVITQTWANKNPKGASHHDHIHPNSVLSGVFYLRLESGMPPIVFNKTVFSNIKRIVKNYNEHNAETFLLPMVSGELIVFPSYLRHMVPTNKSDKERISISFNTFVKDTLGSEKDLTELRVKEVANV